MRDALDALTPWLMTVCICALVGFVFFNVRQCDDASGRRGIERERLSAEMQRAVPAAIEACRVACGERGVHRAKPGECECK